MKTNRCFHPKRSRMQKRSFAAASLAVHNWTAGKTFNGANQTETYHTMSTKRRNSIKNLCMEQKNGFSTPQKWQAGKWILPQEILIWLPSTFQTFWLSSIHILSVIHMKREKRRGKSIYKEALKREIGTRGHELSMKKFVKTEGMGRAIQIKRWKLFSCSSLLSSLIFQHSSSQSGSIAYTKQNTLLFRFIKDCCRENRETQFQRV